MKVHVVNKKLGQTPLEALEKFRKVSRISPTAKLTYAGRLDPMASGVLLILEGASQAEREKYMGLPKVYEAQVLFGFKTDSFDLLGMPIVCHPDRPSAAEGAEGSLNHKELIKTLKSLTGKILLPIPPYSSVPLNGKPMFMHARAGTLKESDIPKREMHIKSIRLVNSKQLTVNSLLSYLQKNINKVSGDFRQKEILKAWEKLLKKQNTKFPVSSFLISVSSGTYIRSIANHLGGTLYSLKRVSVGKYKSGDKLKKFKKPIANKINTKIKKDKIKIKK
jgi:tRNA pseudouridine55 synthase